MKTQLKLLLTTLISMVSVCTSAHDIEVANADGVTIYYVWDKDQTELAVSYQGSYYSYADEYSGNVVIPEFVDYKGNIYSVTRIDDRAFYCCSNLTSVTIPSSVTTIGSSAFGGCSGLTSVTIPSGVTSISDFTFSGCSNLTNLTIPNHVVSIGQNAFYGCTSLNNITIPQTVRSLGYQGFANCSSLTSILIPENVTSLGKGILYGCKALTSLKINCPIIESLFTNNSGTSLPNSLGEVVFGESVKEINTIWGYSYSNSGVIKGKTIVTFNSVKQLCHMKFGSSSSNPISITGKLYINGVESQLDLVLPSDVDSIGSYAFYGCQNLNTILIPDHVEAINDGAFQNCKSLTSVVIGEGVRSIGSYSFSRCTKLSSINMPSNLARIGYQAFMCDSMLTSLSLPPSLTEIGDESFLQCKKLESVNIPNSVTTIGQRVFMDCSSLTSVIIPNSVKSIEGSAFSGCTSLNNVSLPSQLEYVGPYAFNKTPWYENYCKSQPRGLLYFGKVCYKYNGAMPENAKLVVKEGTRYLNASLFSDSTKLVSIELPQSLLQISYGAFSGCSGLTSIDIPSSVTSVGQYAFKGCSGLTSIIIPEGVTSIDSYAFEDCSSLSSITFPGSLKTISDNLFGPNGGSASLTSITVGEGVEEIYGFKGLKNATITLPNSLTKIGSSAFDGCRNCTVIIGTGIKDISNSFSGTRDMTIYIHAFNRPETSYHCFYMTENCKSYVPYGRGDAYRSGRSLEGGYYWCSVSEMPYPALTIGSSGYATYCSNKALDFSEVEDVKAYIATDYITTTNTLLLKRVMKIPAGEGIIVVGKPGTYDIPECTTDITYTNILRGMSYPDYVEPTGGDYANLLITDNKAEISFHPMEDATPFFAGTAYLRLPTDCIPTDAIIVEMPNEDNYIAPENVVACRGGNASLLLPMNNTEQIVGFQFDLQLPKGVTVAANTNGTYAASLTNRKAGHSLSVSKVGENLYRFVSVSMNNSSFSGTEGALLNVKLKIDESVAVGDYEIKVKDTELTIANRSMINSIDGMASLKVQEAAPGDVNGDMKVSVTDVSCIIGYILNDKPITFIESAANVNGDNKVSVTDAVIVIDMILNDSNVSNARKMVQTKREPQ